MKLTIDIAEFLVDTFGMTDREIGQKVMQMIHDAKNAKPVKAAYPPSLVDITRFFLEKGSDEQLARQFFEYYDVAGWKDSRGKKVLSWKQKALSVWINKQKHGKQTNIDKYKSAAERDEAWLAELDRKLGHR